MIADANLLLYARNDDDPRAFARTRTALAVLLPDAGTHVELLDRSVAYSRTVDMQIAAASELWVGPAAAAPA